MEAILSEIEAVLISGFVLPRACNRLKPYRTFARLWNRRYGTSSDGRTVAWYDVSMAGQYPRRDGGGYVQPRCGVIHQGRFGTTACSTVEYCSRCRIPRDVFHKHLK